MNNQKLFERLSIKLASHLIVTSVDACSKYIVIGCDNGLVLG